VTPPPKDPYAATISNEVPEAADTPDGRPALVRLDRGPEADEGVCLWRGPKVVAVPHSDGTLTVPAPRLTVA
jgi:hypothetical protein